MLRMTKHPHPSHHAAHKKSPHVEGPLEQEEKKDLEAIEDGLKAIYGEENADFSKIERPQGWLTKLLLWAVGSLTVIALLAWGGIYFYSRYMTTQDETAFALSIDGLDTVKSGEQVSFEIVYKNPTKVPIASLQIEARLPNGFHIEKATPPPIDLAHPSWDIGYMSAGSDGKITLEGTWVVTVPSSAPLQAFATFRPGNFNSDFQEVATKTVSTTESVLTGTVAVPADMTVGVPGTFTFTATNSGTQPLTNIRSSLALPTGFYLESSAPALESGALPGWNIVSLEPGATSDITVTGSFAADVTGVQELALSYSIVDDEGEHLQTVTKGVTEVKGSDIELSLVAQGSTGSVAAALGSSVPVTIAVKNDGTTTMENVALLLDISGDKAFPINWKQAGLDEGTLTKEGILWDTETIGTIEPGGSRAVNVRLPIVTSLANGMGDTFTLSAVVKRGSATIRSSPITTVLESDARLEATAAYFSEDGIPLGNGPVPPVVGQTTTYRVTWTITNSMHTLTPATVSATLPTGVTFAHQNTADIGTVSLDTATNSVRWDIPSLSAETQSVTATFAVSITPTEADIGTFVKLLSGSLLNATDTKTTTDIERATESLDTEISNDSFAKDKGIVIDVE